MKMKGVYHENFNYVVDKIKSDYSHREALGRS
jgi:hypothetical protein